MLPSLPRAVITEFPQRFSMVTLTIGMILFGLSTLIAIVAFVYNLYLHYKNPGLRVLTKVVILLDFALFWPNFTMFLYFYELFVTKSVHGFLFTNHGFLLFLIFWIIGNNIYINESSRVPEKRREGFKRANILLFILVIFLVIFGLASILYLYTRIVEFIAMVSALFGIVSISYFISMLKKEIRTNPSKLTKARLDLSVYSNIAQLIWIFSAFFNVVLTSIDLDEAGQYPIMVLAITSIVSVFLIQWTISLPEWLRQRYGIGSKRYETIKKLEEQ